MFFLHPAFLDAHSIARDNAAMRAWFANVRSMSLLGDGLNSVDAHNYQSA
jgi:hypothetical protein